jgi:nucleoside-diphosphate-sugar epimerase/ubiquinone/menaquinone biosynthesis C-methylase UbiE
LSDSHVAKRFLITGTTGFLGSHVAARLLREGHSVVALVRSLSRQSADDRFWASVTPLLSDVESVRSRVTVISGDIRLPNLGVRDFTVFVGIDEVIHAASLLKFSPEFRDLVMKTNVAGTENLLGCAERFGWGRFHYVSTAYVCGRSDGLVDERLGSIYSPPDFHNPYEESKWIAEHRVDQWRRATGRGVTIIRPSIVITPGPTDSRLGYYAFATVFKAARTTILSGALPVMIMGNPQTPLNLISVADVVDGIVAIVGQPKLSNSESAVFHLTHPCPISLGAAFKAPLEWMDLDRHVKICDPDMAMPSVTEAAVAKKIRSILSDLFPYLVFKGQFTTKNIRALGAYRPQLVTDTVLRQVLADYFPPVSVKERRIVDAAIRVAAAVVRSVLQPSGFNDGMALYAREARWYRIKHHLTTAFHDARLRRRTAERVRDHVAGLPTAVVLDLATGTGLTVRAISKRVAASVEVIGIDLNPAMLNAASPGGGRLVQGDATDFVRSGMPDIGGGFFVAPNSVDAITMVFGIGGIPDPGRCFDQQLRALKPGGIAVLIDIHSPSLSVAECRMPLGFPASPHLVCEAWNRVTVPIVLRQLWGWGDPTGCFYEMPVVTYYDADLQQSFRFEIVYRDVRTLSWWLGLPVMPIGEWVVRKVAIE